MKHSVLPLLILACLVAACRTEQGLSREPAASAGVAVVRRDYVVMPDEANALQFRLYTNASPDSPHLFDTFDIDAYGQALLRSPAGDGLKQWLATSSSNASLHNLLVNGVGPELASTNSMTVSERASGPDWCYIALDVSAAYRSQLNHFKRGILFVEPDLFILYDHLVARQPSAFQMLLHPPASTSVDNAWGDLRLELPGAGFRIHAPAARKKPRNWEQIESPGDKFLPNTVTLRLGPTTRLTELDLLTVFAIHHGGEKRDYAFRLLESDTAIGARIHRNGLPTLIAFKTTPAAGSASLAGFGFSGPVGVDVFRPKRKLP